MQVLAVDTSTLTGSVALIDAHKVIAEETLNISVTHSERLIATIDNVLSVADVPLADIAGLGVGLGPGSFTGLRIGLAAVKGLAVTRKIPLCGISTLEALAYNAYGSELPIAAILDAKRRELFAAVYQLQRGSSKRLLKEVVMGPAELAELLTREFGKLLVLGDGAGILVEVAKSQQRKMLQRVLPAQDYPRAANIAWLAAQRLKKGRGDDVARLVPNYIRKSDAELKRKKR